MSEHATSTRGSRPSARSCRIRFRPAPIRASQSWHIRWRVPAPDSPPAFHFRNPLS
jgi:hypothetical protein